MGNACGQHMWQTNAFTVWGDKTAMWPFAKLFSTLVIHQGGIVVLWDRIGVENARNMVA